MESTLFQEAIADIDELKRVAEENAKRIVIQRVTPQIRDMIEKKLLAEDDASLSADDEEEDESPAKDDKEVLVDVVEDAHEDGPKIAEAASAISMPCRGSPYRRSGTIILNWWRPLPRRPVAQPRKMSDDDCIRRWPCTTRWPAWP